MAADLQRVYERGAELLTRLARFAAAADEDCVRWLEVGTQQLRMLESPLSIARIMRERLLGRVLDEENHSDQRNLDKGASWIFTSRIMR